MDTQVLDRDAFTIISQIRCNKNMGGKPVLKFQPVYCTDCGREARRLNRNLYYCVECSKEFSSVAEKTGVERECAGCGRKRKITARNLCGSCYTSYYRELRNGK